MNTPLRAAVCAAALTWGLAMPAQAALIFDVGPDFVQPDENLLFNGEDLIAGPAETVQGRTNQTDTIFDLTGTENLFTPASGQARVEDEAQDGFESLFVNALDPTIYFTEFEANLNAVGEGFANIIATDSAGEVFTFTFALDGGGENFFGIRAIDGQRIDTVQITSTVPLHDVRSIRIGGLDEDGGPGNVPEPTTLALLGGALLAHVAVRRRR